MSGREATSMTFQEREPFCSRAVGKGLIKKWEVSRSVRRRNERLEHYETRCALREIRLRAEGIVQE